MYYLCFNYVFSMYYFQRGLKGEQKGNKTGYRLKGERKWLESC